MARLDIDIPLKRVDERDTMFARAARRPGTPPYVEYYARRPELKPADDALRALPPLLDPRGRFYDAALCSDAEEYFKRIDRIEVDVDIVGKWAERIEATADPAGTVKSMLLSIGAVAAGVTRLEEKFIYTHKGRFDDEYGTPIELRHASAFVFLVEMDFDAMQAAPRAATVRESARQYYRAARIAMTAAAALRAAGHQAKPHYDAHYDVMLPPLAVRAGLGELGRNNILVADRYGSRVRIGAVTTDLAPIPDRPIDLGVAGFCAICRKCAENCPSRALSIGERAAIRGVRKWPTDVARCYGYWLQSGTDCGICMAVCPFSHRDSPFHNLVRRAVRIHPLLARLALLGDDIWYGRRWTAGRRWRRAGRPDRPH
jgi:reductive dehalogenase